MPQGVTLGADPEFIFVGEDGIVPAVDFFDRQDNHGGNNPEIGGDGHPYTAEVRPAASDTPQELVANLKDIFTRNHVNLPQDLSWIAGSFVEGKAIGGHIHFGGIDATDEIVCALDGILAQMIILMEDTSGARQRRASIYGQLKDVRNKDWGFEYRPLPSWIVSESISLAVVSLARAIIHEEVEEGDRSIRKLSREDLLPLIDIDRTSFKKCNKSYFEEKFDTLFDHAQQLSYWATEEGKELRKTIEVIRFVVKTFPDWNNDKDILERWGIRPTPEYYKFTRTEIRPVIELDEFLNVNAGWDRLALNL